MVDFQVDGVLCYSDLFILRDSVNSSLAREQMKMWRDPIVGILYRL